jgi:hypothetical protein
LLRLKIMCLRVSYKKKIKLKVTVRKESDPEVDLDPLVRGTDPHQNVTDPQH